MLDRAKEAAARAGLELSEGEAGLALSDGRMSLKADFYPMLVRAKQGRLQRELLVRAAKAKDRGVQPIALDATAGLGDDSFLLAAAGFVVTLYERNPVIAALLADALERAAEDPDLARITGRMTMVEGDSVAALRDLATCPEGLAALPLPDVVLLDPMFPTKQKSSAVKKKLQILQKLEQPCEDESALMDAALAVHPRKVIVKRPAKGPYLAGCKPAYSLVGKAIRFDCYVPASQRN